MILKKYLPSHTIYSSELTRLESRLLAIRENNLPIVQQYDAFFSACEFIPLNRDVFEYATALRAEKQLKIPDALHLACAIVGVCDEFWTNDLRLAKYATEKIVVKDWSQLESLMKNNQ